MKIRNKIISVMLACAFVCMSVFGVFPLGGTKIKIVFAYDLTVSTKLIDGIVYNIYKAPNNGYYAAVAGVGIELDYREEPSDVEWADYKLSLYATDNNYYYNPNLIIPSEIQFKNKVVPVTTVQKRAFEDLICCNTEGSIYWRGNTFYYAGDDGRYSPDKRLKYYTTYSAYSTRDYWEKDFCAALILDKGLDNYVGASKYIESIVIPDSVTTIDSEAFYGCSGLKELSIPDSVDTIGESAFYGCSGLKELSIPDSVDTIGESAFYGCSGLTEINIPNSVDTIGDSAFYGCSGLTEITIPDSVVSIGDYAFKGCSGLTEITIPDSVVSIGDYAFKGCSGLTEINIPDSVVSIGDYAFNGCSGLTEITIPDSVDSIGNGVFSICSGLTEITIPDSVVSIGNGAFSECIGLTEITIPDSVVSIGNSAFVYCSGLTEITIPDSVDSIGDYAFAACSGLNEIVIPDSVDTIGQFVFLDCSSLKSVVLSNNITQIKKYTFVNCEKLQKVYVPAIKTKFETGAFTDCYDVTIYCLANSNAERYADANGLKKVILNADEFPTAPPTTTTQTTPSLYGDANCDSTINLNDAVAILQFVALPTKYPITNIGQLNADIVDRGTSGVNGLDALAIQMIDANLIKTNELPVTSQVLTEKQK